MGSGPYTLDDYSREQGTYRFVAFDQYWGPKPRVDVIEQIPASEPVLAFEKGEIDFAEITQDILNRFTNKPEYRVIQNPPFHGVRLSFNMEKRPELKDKAVRQAFAYAIDQAELVEKVLRGAGIPGSAGYLPQEHPYYNNKVKSYPFDPAKAKQLLNGKELTFELNIPNMEQTVRTAELIKISLKKAGIALNVHTYDTKTNDELVRKGNYELAVNVFGGWGADPDQLRTIFATKPSGQGFSEMIGYENAEINQLAANQMVELDEKKRREIINQLQEQIAEEVPTLTLFSQKAYYVFRPGKFDGWMYMYDHHSAPHSKLTYLTRK
ncbi:Periplasmic dipeptide transport protein precursor [compost metagenome]